MISLICGDLQLLHAETPESQLFYDGILSGNSYVCEMMLNDPEIQISNILKEMSDLPMKHVFSACIAAGELSSRPRKEGALYYVRPSSIRNAEILMDQGVSVSNIDIWQVFPAEWSPEAEALAKRIYKISPFGSYHRWPRTAALYDNHYREWVESLGVKPGAVVDLSGASWNLDELSDLELINKLGDYYDLYELYCIFDTLMARCASGVFTEGERLFEAFDVRANSKWGLSQTTEEMKYMLHALGDRRIIPYLLTTGRGERDSQKFRNRYLIKSLDPDLYMTLFPQDPEDEPQLYELESFNLKKIAEALEPYYRGEADAAATLSLDFGRYRTVRTVMNNYFSSIAGEELEKGIPEWENTLRMGRGEERIAAAEKLAFSEKGKTVLKSYLFETWSPDLFLYIFKIVSFDGSEESLEEMVSAAQLRWRERSCYEKNKVLSNLDLLNKKITEGES